MIGMIIGAVVGTKLGRKYWGPEGEKNIYSGHLGDDESKPAVVITQVFHHGKSWYKLYLAAEGDSACVGERPDYAAILALLQQWEKYVAKGGNLNRWRFQEELRARECAQLEKGLRK